MRILDPRHAAHGQPLVAAPPLPHPARPPAFAHRRGAHRAQLELALDGDRQQRGEDGDAAHEVGVASIGSMYQHTVAPDVRVKGAKTLGG